MKNLMVSFLAVASLLLLVASVSAAQLTDDVVVKVDGTDAGYFDGTTYNVWENMSVVAGEEITVKVTFTALENDTDVTFEAELEGEKVKTSKSTMEKGYFDTEAGQTYSAYVTLEVPFELKDDLSNDLTLNLELDGKDHKTTIDNIEVRVQRPSYNPEVKSVTVDQSVRAGSTFPVDVVLKNMGYNDLDDIYVTVTVAELGLSKSVYFGDLVPIETCDDDDCDKEDTVAGRLYLSVPYDAAAGTYTLNVRVQADSGVDMTGKTNLVVSNDFADTVIVSSTSKTVEAGESAVYSLLLVNPTDQVVVYTLTTDGDLSASLSENVVAVPAGSSKTVEVTASAEEAGTYAFSVNVLSNGQLAKTVALTLEAEGSSAIDPIVILTIVLAIVFVVLLVVLIVLISKKPEKAEEFGESYY